MESQQTASTRRVISYSYMAALIALGIALLYHHFQIIVAPIPLDLYEGTMPFITGLIAEGENPYTFAHQPIATNVYPPLYNIIAAPLTLIFGNTLVLHRLLSALFIFLSCTLIIRTLYVLRVSGANLLAAGLTLYSGLIFYSTPIASTNALGLFLFLGTLLVPYHYNFSARSLIASLIFSLLAFYAKQYFILGMAILCLYVFLYYSMRRALLLGLAFAALLLTSLSIVHSYSPYFLDNTLFSSTVAINTISAWAILTKQLTVFGYLNAGLLAILLLQLIKHRSVFFVQVRQHLKLRTPIFSSAALLQYPSNYFLFTFLWATLAIVFTLGKNPGNYMTYLFQLMSPGLILLAFCSMEKHPINRWLSATGVIASLLLMYNFLPKDFSYTKESWEKIDQLVAENDNILASQMLLMPLLNHQKTIHQGGHTIYFSLADKKPKIFQKKDPKARVSSIWSNYIASIYRKIEHKEFDLIALSSWQMKAIFDGHPPPKSHLNGREFLKKHYYVTDKLELSLTDRHGGGTYKLKIWRPRDS